MKFKLVPKSFAEEMSDKKLLTQKYGKKGILLYRELSKYKTLSEDDLRKLIFNLELPEEVFDFLVEKGILEKDSDEISFEEPRAEEPSKEGSPLFTKEENLSSEPNPLEIESSPPSMEEPLQPSSTPKVEEPPMELPIKPELPEEASPQQTIPSGSPVENTIRRKYGENGIKVFNYAQQGKTVKEISQLTSIPIEDIVEIMDFLKAMGLLSSDSNVAHDSKFTPLIEGERVDIIEEVEAPIEDEIEGYRYIGSGGLEKYTVSLDVALKFGKEGRILFEHMLDKQEKDILDLVTGLSIPIDTVKKIMSHLEKKKLIERRILSRQEVRKKYGYDAFAIYKRFGAKGVLFYKMLGGDYSTRESVKIFSKLSGIKDPDKILEIMKMIHSILGLTIPITRQNIIEILKGD